MDKYLNIYYDSNGVKIFRYHFPSLSALVDYLRTAPICIESFPGNLYSEQPNREGKTYRGESLADTLDHLTTGYLDTYAKYRENSHVDQIRIDVPIDYTRVRETRSYVGNRVDVQAFVEGNPKCMIRKQRIEPKKNITIHFELSHRSIVKEPVLFNKGMCAMLIIKALEQNNFNVNLNCYLLVGENNIKASDKKCDHDREILYFSINLKDLDLPLDELKCIGPMMRIEFYRRAIFRLMETTPLHRKWNIGYGYELPDAEKENIIKPGIDDITFNYSLTKELGGVSLEKDLETSIDYLGLQDFISLRKRLK